MNTRWSLSSVLLLSALVSAQQAPVPVQDEPHHHVVLKNDSVMVLRAELQPGESTLPHTHLNDRFAVVLSNAIIMQQKVGEAAGAPEAMKPGDVLTFVSSGPFSHITHNDNKGVFEVLDVELLHRPATATGQPAAKVEAENPSAWAYKWTLAPGATSTMHTHERPYLIIAATPLVLKMTDPEGKSFTHEVKAGDVHWVDAKVTHSLANESTTVGQIVEIELK